VKKRKVAYLGPAGTYTEEAASRYAPDAVLVPYPTIFHAAEAVEKGETGEAVVPIENSLYGSVADILDFLIAAKRTLIRDEMLLRIEHCLMALPGVRLQGVNTVLAHPQALGQCRKFLMEKLPRAQQSPSVSNAAAAAEVKGGRKDAAAIGPRRAAEIYGLEVIAESIQDSRTNITRFVVLAPTDHAPTGRDKTSFCYDVKDEPGVLYRSLRPLADRRINLSKIESRPAGDMLGRYIFLLDIDGHRTDGPVAEALKEMRAMTQMLKVLGSYPRASLPQ